ncbi:hypothetical protein V6N11_076519 [Hibiscus sabdariffa]|uniref:Uncharacterized protein n=1 Tax=Hibiscus sabdariffa TaxID=183260 RepID=A0ABR2Q6H7_9ROSI
MVGRLLLRAVNANKVMDNGTIMCLGLRGSEKSKPERSMVPAGAKKIFRGVAVGTDTPLFLALKRRGSRVGVRFLDRSWEGALGPA